MREDFAHFFEHQQFYAWDSSVSNRAMAWEAWIENKLTFWQALRLMFPVWSYSHDLAARFREYKKISARRLCLFYIEGDGSLYLFGKRYTVPDGDYEALIRAMRQVLAEKRKTDPNFFFDPPTIVQLEHDSLIIPYEKH